MLGSEYEYSVSDLGFSSDITLAELKAREDLWELCNSNGQKERKTCERMEKKKDKSIQDPEEKRHKRWQEGQPSTRSCIKSDTHDIVTERKLIGKKMNLQLSSMPGIILNPVDKIKYEKATENLLISKMRRVCMFPEDDADDHEEDSFLETWNYKHRQRVLLEKREKLKVDKPQPRIVFLKNKKEMKGYDSILHAGKKVLQENTIFTANSINCAQKIIEKNKFEKPVLHTSTQHWKRKWKSSEYFLKMSARCQATTSNRVKAYTRVRKSGPDLGGVLVCKSVSGDMENRSELVNKIIEGLFPTDDQTHELKQKKNTCRNTTRNWNRNSTR